MRHLHTATALMLTSALWIIPAAAQNYGAGSPAAGSGTQQTPVTPDEDTSPAPASQAAPPPAVPSDVTAAPTGSVETTATQTSSDANQATNGATLNGATAGSISASQLTSLEGKTVTGAKGQALGSITAVDQSAQKVQLQASNGKAVALPSALFHMEGDRAMAPTVSNADVLAMAATQNGDTQAASRASVRGKATRSKKARLSPASAKPSETPALAPASNRAPESAGGESGTSGGPKY